MGADGQHPLFIAFTENFQRSASDIDLFMFESDQLTESDAGGIKQGKDRLCIE